MPEQIKGKQVRCLYELVTVSKWLWLECHWVTGKADIEILYKSGNLPVVGAGNADSRSRVIDCTEMIMNSRLPVFQVRRV